MVSEKEVEAARAVLERRIYDEGGCEAEQVPAMVREMLEAAARVRAEANNECGEAAHPAPQPSWPVEALKRITQLKEVRRGGGVFDYEPALSAMEMYEIAFDALAALTAGKPHPDDEAVDRFAAAMKAKLKWEREERGRHGWNDPEVCSEEYLAKLLIEHLAKGNDGNFEDVANFCMMLHQRGAHPRVMADALEAAARVRAEDNAGEPVAWPKIMYVCENCLEYNPEMCGHDRRDIYVTPDGRWLCDSCIDEEGTSSRDCTTPPMLYAHPAPQPRGKIEEAATALDKPVRGVERMPRLDTPGAEE